MKSHSPRTPVTRHQPSRGRVACTFCHLRRIRCDAFQRRPCSNCTSSKQTCQLIESRRGKYLRAQRKKSPIPWGQFGSFHSSPVPLHSVAKPEPIPDFGTFSSSFFDLASLAGPTEGFGTYPKCPDWMENKSIFSAHTRNQDHPTKEGSEMLYARLSEFHLSRGRNREIECRRTIYLGESFDLTYIVHEVASVVTGQAHDFFSKLQLPVPPTVDDRPMNLGYDTRLEPEEIEILKWRGAFTLPENGVSDRLIRLFFDYVHPAFPIFDRVEFAHLYMAKRLSFLTLQTVFLLAVTLCDEDLIHEAGFLDRNAARKIFHKRAKALYDADYEADKVTLVQALFLISFCWNGSMDDKDMFHWLGAAIGLAQTQGMHRSTLGSELSLKDQRLWKRIWWSLYGRDRHAAAGLGRPVRIRDEDCDVEMLEECDFEETGYCDPNIFGVQTRTHVLYAIHLAKLSVVYGNILSIKFAINKPVHEEENTTLMTQMKQWKQELPVELIVRELEHGEDDLHWANMIELIYNHHQILLHRPILGSTVAPGDSTEGIAFNAANKITRIVDDLLTTGMLRRTQLQICLSLFAALTMYTIIMRRPDPIQRKRAENNARICKLGLSELAKSWPACSWILGLFDNLLGNERSCRSNDQGSMEPSLRKPCFQPSLLSSIPPSTAQFDAEMESEGLRQNPYDSFIGGKPSMHTNFDEENHSTETSNYMHADQPAFYSSEVGVNFVGDNQELLSYLMQHFPDP